ncbi:MAG: Subtilisin-like protease 2 [Claussenomyces sp. TS43310]|nr:MAG: Subtilisin-like protease 2 [Claussenomyces sp. TS43310]
MVFFGRLAAVAAVLAPAVLGAPTSPHPKILNPLAADVVADSYIVVYHPNITSDGIASHVESVSSILSKRSSASGVGQTYNLPQLKGYQVTADSSAIAQIADSPEVAYIEKDAKVYASGLTTQADATWGLGRISHQETDSTDYIYDTTAGSGATVYVVDTGIYIGHEEFGGRAKWGANYVSGSENTDENGHGTHCSGTIGGSTYGVAKKVSLVAVKVLNKNGQGQNSGVISGIQYVHDNAGSNSVLSMSLGGGKSSAINSAVASTVDAGVTVVVAAGNDDEDASNSSPASEPSAITVGAIDDTDARASFSNYGKLVDVFAPGVDVLSSWIGSTDATNTISGTSMATPHVAGLAAYLIILDGLSSPADVVSRITSLAISGDISDAGSGSPNLIAYNGNGA